MYNNQGNKGVTTHTSDINITRVNPKAYQTKVIPTEQPSTNVLKNSPSPSNKVTVGVDDSGGNSVPEKHMQSFDCKS